MPAERIATFEAFWPFYISQHAKSGTRLLHFVGTTLGLLIAAAALITSRPFLILWALVAAYGFAWVGHFFIEKNRPATFQYPLWSLRGDFRMVRMAVTGTLDEELRRTGVADQGSKLIPDQKISPPLQAKDSPND
jgi:hypothetical protein